MNHADASLVVTYEPPIGDDKGGYSIGVKEKNGHHRRVAFVWPYAESAIISGEDTPIAPFGAHDPVALSNLFALAPKLADELEYYRDKWNRLMSVLRCPECGSMCISLTDGLNPVWNCDNCKYRWHINGGKS